MSVDEKPKFKLLSYFYGQYSMRVDGGESVQISRDEAISVFGEHVIADMEAKRCRVDPSFSRALCFDTRTSSFSVREKGAERPVSRDEAIELFNEQMVTELEHP